MKKFKFILTAYNSRNEVSTYNYGIYAVGQDVAETAAMEFCLDMWKKKFGWSKHNVRYVSK